MKSKERSGDAESSRVGITRRRFIKRSGGATVGTALGLYALATPAWAAGEDDSSGWLLAYTWVGNNDDFDADEGTHGDIEQCAGSWALGQSGGQWYRIAAVVCIDSLPNDPPNTAVRWDPVFTGSGVLEKIDPPTQQDPYGSNPVKVGDLPGLTNGAWIKIDGEGNVTGGQDEDFDGEDGNGFGTLYMQIDFIGTGNNPVIRAKVSGKSSAHGISNQNWAVLIAEYKKVRG